VTACGQQETKLGFLLPELLVGDCNCDGQIDYADRNPFVALLRRGVG
jgi:hypothetical protein